jgi:molecular chaperone GrpE (heat shock protein)
LREKTETEQQQQRQQQEAEQDPETKEMQLAKLKQQHAELGGRLSQLLRDKAAAEETKKRLSDGLLRTKARMKEIERRLGK